MLSDDKVVIVEPDSANLARLVALFAFMQFETVAYPSVDAIPLDRNDQLDWVAIKLGQNNSAGAMRELLTRLREGKVRAVDGTEVEIRADTVCLHGDGEHAVAFARRLRDELKAAGVEVRAFAA